MSSRAPHSPSRRPAAVTALASAALAAGMLAVPQSASAAATRIHDIQGSTRISPLAGKKVSDVPGIVTGVRSDGDSRGFWVQDPDPDNDPATSEGVFVYTGSTTPNVKSGDSVLVSGTVSEYYPGGKEAGGQSVTEITSATVTVKSSGNQLPAPVKLGSDVPAKYAPDANGGSIEGLTLKPDTYALDYYESLEGMRVSVSDAPVVGPTDSYDELWVSDRSGDPTTARGGLLYSSYDNPNGSRLKVSSLLSSDFPKANVGDKLSGTTTGPLDYDNFGGYDLAATSLGKLTPGHLPKETTTKQSSDQLAMATYNVENLSPTDPQSKFDQLATGLVKNLASPDIVALEEVQDNNGSEDNGVVDADQTIKKLTDAIKAAGGPAYDYKQINPTNGQDGGEPGGNIRSVFLYNPDRVSFTDVAGGNATTPVTVEDKNGEPSLSASPGRIDPTNDAWTDSRKPLVGQFSFKGHTVFAVANHFDSKLGDQGLDSRYQPPARSSETQRKKQATLVNGFVKDLLKVDSKADVVVMGDLNDYQFSPALSALTDGKVLTDLVTTLPSNQQYGYVYQGNSQVLDHILVSSGLGKADYDAVHINAEFADQTSDHDPQVVRLTP